jgi:hypothetical protein
MAYFGYRKVKPVLGADRDYSACTITNSNGSGNPQCGGSATAFPGNIFLFTTLDATTSTTAALGPGTLTLGAGPNIFNYGPLNHFQRPDERYVAGAFADYEISPAIQPYLEFMFMDDRTLAQIAPSGDFFNTTSFNCDNPLMSDEQRAIICADPNQVVGFVGNFPVAAGAPYNDLGVGGVPLLTPIDFIAPEGPTGATFRRGFGFLARRNVEGGNRIADLKHTTYRGVVGTRGDISNVWSYDASGGWVLPGLGGLRRDSDPDRATLVHRRIHDRRRLPQVMVHDSRQADGLRSEVRHRHIQDLGRARANS